MSKGRWSLSVPAWHEIYWKRTLPREQSLKPWGPEGPAPEQTERAAHRAREIYARYKRLQRKVSK